MTHTEGPWSVCNNGNCECKVVWCADHPVAEVIHGPWGDKYPSIRLVGESLEVKAEAYMNIIEYGSVDSETAKANALLIAAAPELLEAINLAKEELCRCADKFGCTMDDSLFPVLQRVNAAIEKATVPPEPKPPIDIMEALKASMAALNKPQEPRA